MKRGREKRLASAVCCDQRRAARVTAGDEVWAGWRSREPTASRPLAEQLGGLRPLWQPTSARHAPCAGPEGGKADPGIGTNQQWGRRCSQHCYYSTPLARPSHHSPQLALDNSRSATTTHARTARTPHSAQSQTHLQRVVGQQRDAVDSDHRQNQLIELLARNDALA